MLERPKSVTAISWLLIAFAIIYFFVFFFMSGFLFVSGFVISSKFFFLVIVTTLVQIVMGVGMLNGKNWARLLFLWLTPIDVLVGLVVWFLGGEESLGAIIKIIWYIIFAVYLTRPVAVAYFKQYKEKDIKGRGRLVWVISLMLVIIPMVILWVFWIDPTQNVITGVEEKYILSLFDRANEDFRQANYERAGSEEADRLYKNAILTFEKIIDEGKVKNAKLYYNLANAYFLKGEIGKAILNYRRAEKLDNSDANIQKNLTFARSKRIDKVVTKTEKRVLQTLFFWHYDFSIKAKFLFTCIFFGVVCICVAAIIWFGRSAPWMIPAVICAILTICFLVSLVVESGTEAGRICGVITIGEVVARQGDGQNYAPSFKEPLHEGTEFVLLESRPGWFHIELTDDSDAWIPQISADLV